MSHPIHRIREFEIVDAYTLRIDFEDGVSRAIDFSPVLEGELFGPLKDADQAPVGLSGANPLVDFSFDNSTVNTYRRAVNGGTIWMK